MSLCEATRDYLCIALCYCYAACFLPLLFIEWCLNRDYTAQTSKQK